ncbi:MAG: glycine dehydrogenase, partial [Chloroflexi bacterium]|nr:glycine dehydrogenase [Chloroflexota bacterium]
MPDPGGAPTPYIPNTDADRAAMLARLELTDLDTLFDELPVAHRDPAIALPDALAEADLIRLLQDRAAENGSGGRPSFLGAGAYRRAIPAVTGQLTSRSEFVTSYTPYQPEVSQGTLQAAFEYQSVVCELTGMDVSNTGMYDGASATAEACMLAARATRRSAVALLEPIDPRVADVVRTYAYGANIRVDRIHADADVAGALGDEHAALVVQQPDFLGGIRDLAPLTEAAHAAGALCVVAADPFALAMLRSPGDGGADIVTGEGRDLAGPPGLGGPSLGLFA